MRAPIFIALAVEDRLSETVLRSLLQQSGRNFEVVACYSRGGFGYLKKQAQAFNQAAKHKPFLMLADLDRSECPPVLIQEWLKGPKHDNFLFRIAVREVESWLMAHREAFARFLGIKTSHVAVDPDTLGDPKIELIRLVRRSKKRKLQDAILPVPGASSKVGPDYNGQLGFFVKTAWKADVAARHSPSLARTLESLKKFPSK